MDETIKIKCPYCSAVLTVRNIVGIETKNVTCPICRQKSPFTDYKAVAAVSEGTLYPGQLPGDDPSAAALAAAAKSLSAQLQVLPRGESFTLADGDNIVGRKASQSKATIQIDTGDERRLSREHVVLTREKVAGKGVVHTIRLCKEKSNPTHVNSTLLEYGDCLILHDGDTIHLPSVDLRFALIDDEGTQL